MARTARHGALSTTRRFRPSQSVICCIAALLAHAARSTRISISLRSDLARDVILERLNREVGQGDLVVALLPGSSSSKGELTIEQVKRALAASRTKSDSSAVIASPIPAGDRVKR